MQLKPYVAGITHASNFTRAYINICAKLLFVMLSAVQRLSLPLSRSEHEYGMLQTSLRSWLRSPSDQENKQKQSEVTNKVTSCIDALSLPLEAADPDISPKPVSADAGPPSCAYVKDNVLHVNQTYALPANVVVVPCTRENVKSYRRFNQLMLPIPYGDAFYTDTVHDPVISDLTRLAYWHNSGKQNTSGVHVLTSEDGEARVGHNAPPRLVSAIRCQLLQHSSYVTHDPGKVLYISAISTLSPFRQHGLATHLLDLVKRAAIQQYGVVAIIAHVWEANSDAMSWYERRGFKSVSIDEQYYRRLAPRTAAYVVRRELGPSDLLHGVAA